MMVSLDATSDSRCEVRKKHKTAPIPESHGIETHKGVDQSSSEERFFLRMRKGGENDKLAKLEMALKTTAIKGTLDREEIARQVHALKLTIEIMQGKRKMLEKLLDEKEKVWAKHDSHLDLLRREINLWEYEMKAVYENNISYVKLVSENNNLRRENDELKKQNQYYEIKCTKLEKKYRMLKEDLEAEFNNLPNLLPSKTFSINQPTETEENETVTEEEKFHRDLDAAISASIAISKFDPQEKHDYDLKQEINFALELSKKEDEIRKQREHSLAFEELFKNNVEAERAAKRKLEDMKTEKENVTKRLKVVEQQKDILADEKEKLVDELECTTLCGFCTERLKDVAFEPCGHIWACSICVVSANLSNCPTCREHIKNVRKVFLA